MHDAVLGKLPRTTGWQPVLPGTKRRYTFWVAVGALSERRGFGGHRPPLQFCDSR
jgi:hypothetical protein